jgi:hypothetical protein
MAKYPEGREKNCALKTMVLVWVGYGAQPEDGVNWVMRLPEGNDKELALPAAVHAWFLVDAYGARHWISNSKLPEKTKTRLKRENEWKTGEKLEFYSLLSPVN